MKISSLFNVWYNVLLHPRETFKKEKSNATFKNVLIHMGLGGVIVGVTVSSIALFMMYAMGGFEIDLYILGILFLFGIIVGPLFVILNVLINSGILFIVAKLLKGKGSYVTQTYLISIFIVPLVIIDSSILLVFSFTGLWPPPLIMAIILNIIGLILLVYALYLLTLALKETHSYSTRKAFATWGIPVAISVVIFIMQMFVLFFLF